eukprot:206253-Heterocapsa_arctica.AAC.1
MLLGVMKPKWSGLLASFANKLGDWELALQRYEQATGVPMPDEVKCSVASMNAPRAVQSYIR